VPGQDTEVIRIRRITQNDPLYAQELALREEVLLRPVGLDIEGFQAEFPGAEERFEHFVAVFNHPLGDRVIGCATLLVENGDGAGEGAVGVGKLMQMAVDPQRQGEGIGRRLVVAVESRAFGELGLRELYCHAREDVVGFYAALGWEVEGDGFEEVGIPHRRMVVRAEEETAG
jgi:predicted GNAT family N-acyltransferase